YGTLWLFPLVGHGILLMAQVGAPAAELGDVARARDAVRLANETLHLAPVGEFERADSQRRRDLGHEFAERGMRELPDLHGDGSARGGPRQAGLGRRAVGQRIQAVRRGAVSGFEEARPARGQLMV